MTLPCLLLRAVGRLLCDWLVAPYIIFSDSGRISFGGLGKKCLSPLALAAFTAITCITVSPTPPPTSPAQRISFSPCVQGGGLRKTKSLGKAQLGQQDSR